MQCNSWDYEHLYTVGHMRLVQRRLGVSSSYVKMACCSSSGPKIRWRTNCIYLNFDSFAIVQICALCKAYVLFARVHVVCFIALAACTATAYSCASTHHLYVNGCWCVIRSCWHVCTCDASLLVIITTTTTTTETSSECIWYIWHSSAVCDWSTDTAVSEQLKELV
jgi:hypothetical protein